MKRFALAIFVLTALVTSVLLALNWPRAEASPDATITVNSSADTVIPNGVLTLREAMLLAIGDLDVSALTELECGQVSTAVWGTIAPPNFVCFSSTPPGGISADTIDFDPTVFLPGRPPITLTDSLPELDTGNDTVDGSSATVVVEGTTSFACFVISSDHNTIKGLEIYGCGSGVSIDTNGDHNTIGGTAEGERNVISGGTTGHGVYIQGSNNTVKGNYLGTNASGDAARANFEGVLISGAADGNVIGGSTESERNLISGNNYGLTIRGSNNTVEGNYIGTNAAGDGPIPNGTGVSLYLGAQDNTIGGTGSGEGNLIAFNDYDGVEVDGAGTTGNTIRGNSIHSNGDKGIETENGGNEELAPPAISGFASVTGTACSYCTIDIYSDNGSEGRVYEGSITGNGDGDWSFPDSVEGPNVTATATDSAGNTSEFSEPATVPEATPTPSPTPTPTGMRTVTIPARSWANFSWTGDSSPQDVADCFDEGRIAVIYRLDAETQVFEAWFRGAETLSTMDDVARFDALLALNSSDQPATCEMPGG